jgi:hypothetical protein
VIKRYNNSDVFALRPAISRIARAGAAVPRRMAGAAIRSFRAISASRCRSG